MRYAVAEKLEIIRLVEQSSLSARRTLALSLPGIPSEPDIERPRVTIELTRVSETGSDLNHKRPMSGRDRRTSR
jgi:hypothetical protein